MRDSPERAEQAAALVQQRAEEAAAKKRRSPSKTGSGRKTPENSEEMCGFPWATWFTLRDTANEILQARAAARETIAYVDLWEAIGQQVGQDLGPHRFKIEQLLLHLTEATYEDLGVLITALVVNADKEGPAHGFFKIAVQLGALPPFEATPKGQTWSMSDEQRAFWLAQRDATFERFAPA